MILFDTHAHLDDERFEGDRDEIVAAMAREGIALCVTAGSDMDSSAASVALAGRHGGVYAAVGIHPHEASSWNGGCARRLTELAAGPKAVAIGEIGLDYHYGHSPREIQRRALAEQMALAVSLGLPAVFHVREAWGDFLPLLRGPTPAGVMHCFSGSVESARLCLDAGLYVSFAGTVTYKNARHLHEAARYVPADRLLVETDSPYLSPEPLRGRRNDPRNVRLVAARLAGLRGVSEEEIARVTLENGCRLFGIAIPGETGETH
jgi:TatD DNase family protein